VSHCEDVAVILLKQVVAEGGEDNGVAKKCFRLILGCREALLESL
jgi:hypothetical protein